MYVQQKKKFGEETPKNTEKVRLTTPSTAPSFSRLTTSQSMKSRINPLLLNSKEFVVPQELHEKSSKKLTRRFFNNQTIPFEWFSSDKKLKTILVKETSKIEKRVFDCVLEEYLDGRVSFQDLLNAKNFPWTLFLSEESHASAWLNHINMREAAAERMSPR